MLIISQDRISIVETTGVSLKMKQDSCGYNIVARTATDIVTLGTYYYEDAAKETLEKIYDAYAASQKTFRMPN